MEKMKNKEDCKQDLVELIKKLNNSTSGLCLSNVKDGIIIHKREIQPMKKILNYLIRKELKSGK